MGERDVSEPVDYGLIISFPDQSESFVLGFEAGGLWGRIRRGDVAEVEITTHTLNREVISRMATAEGWDVEYSPSGVNGWDNTTLTKVAAASDRPNPRGLRVVE